MNVDEKNNKERLPFEHYLGLYKQLDPLEVSKRCKVPYDEEKKEFHLTMINQEYIITFPDYKITVVNDDGSYHALTEYNASEILILRYFIESKNTVSTGIRKAYRDMPWGEVYFKQFNGRCILRLCYGFGNKLDVFAKVMEKMGAVKKDMGDCSYELEFLPNLFIDYILWAGDDEFPPSSQILFSENFTDAFQAEDMAVIGDITIGAMKKIAASL
ncbi:protein of unknown function [Acetitomaculum ruminis DSM 5522]|uniref:DUF3786 domain-containing protein n=1 Tax=Acetitomaculum ruminis DSM 5522 TaxID=1120918 RepID=A0A1I0XLA0_9FIRM|nr:DUF3786 domain-containing protein [Acetitomaculum ruminis]SFB01825.1 protein of unknown function [Acetitomaculum ruminis DSM 5522]